MLPRVLINNRIVNEQLLESSFSIESVITNKVDTASFKLIDAPNIGHALKFDGADDLVIINKNDALRVSDGSWELWVKFTSTTDGQRVMDCDGAGVNLGDCTLQTEGAGKLAFYFDDGTGFGGGIKVISNAELNDGVWHHVVVTFGQTGMKMYVDGMQQTSTHASTLGATSSTDIGLGGRALGAAYLACAIDGVRVFSRALDVDEALANYNAGRGRHKAYSYDNCVGEWHFDEGSGTQAVDTSVVENHGTISGAVYVTGHVARDIVEKKDEVVITDVVDQYLELVDGSSVSIPDDDSLDVDFSAGESLTFEVVFTANAITCADWKRIAAKAMNYGLMMRDGGDLRYTWHNGVAWQERSLCNFTAGRHHVIFTATPTGGNHYIETWLDGVLADSATLTGQPQTSPDPATIGYPSSGYTLDGYIHEWRMYRRTFDASEVLANYNKGDYLACPSNQSALFLWLTFDELSGSTVHDHSPYGNHGTIYGGATRNIKRHYAGYIGSVERNVEGITPVFNLKCQDYTVLLDEVMVNDVYDNQTSQAVLADVFTDCLPEVDTSTYVSTGIIHPRLVFNRIPVIEAMETIAGETGYNWYIDYEKNLHFFPKDENIAPFNLSDSPDAETTFSFADHKYKKQATALANLVTIEGGYYYSEDIDFELPNNGQTTELSLPYKLHSPTGYDKIRVYKNIGDDTTPSWTELTLGADNVDSLGSGIDVLHNFGEKLLKFEVAPPDLSRAVKVTGQYEVPVLVRARSTTSYAKYGRWFEHKIVNKDIDNRDWAKLEAKAYLARHAFESESGQLTVLKDGLIPGQLIHVTDNIRGVDGDYVINKVSMKLLGAAQWSYVVSYGEHNPDLLDMLLGLKRNETQKYDKPSDEVLNEVIEHSETLALFGETDCHEDGRPAQNDCDNPSFESNTTNWVLGSNWTRDSTHAYSGTWALKGGDISTNSYRQTVGPFMSLYYTGMYVCISAWVWCDMDNCARLTARFGATTTYSGYHTGSSTWERLHIVCLVDNDSEGYPWFQLNKINAGNCWFDAIQVERVESMIAIPTPYFDGSLGDGSQWLGTAHLSQSIRTVNRWIVRPYDESPVEEYPPPYQNAGHNVEHEALALSGAMADDSHITENYTWDGADTRWSFFTWAQVGVVYEEGIAEEVDSLLAEVLSTDAGCGGDSDSMIALLTAIDGGSADEALNEVTAELSDSDTGVGGDAPLMDAGYNDSDSGSGTDTGMTAQAELADSDTGSAAEDDDRRNLNGIWDDADTKWDDFLWA